MNQSILLNNNLRFIDSKNVWVLTGFYQSQNVVIYISVKKLAKDSVVSESVIFDIEADIEEYLENNEPDDNGDIWL